VKLVCRHLATIGVCAGLLAGCGGFRQSALPMTTGDNAAKGLRQRDLLYVANSDGTVNVYRYWQRTLAGVLTNFSKPRGMCADAAGNVYITDAQAQKIYEYSHGGKKPINVVDDSPYQPYGCAVNPLNGDLAVANSANGSSIAGNLAIYPHGGGEPKTYTPTHAGHFINCAYDDRGDLFANDRSLYSYPYFSVSSFYYLPKHGTKLIEEDLSEPYFSYGWPYVYSIAYDGKYWVVTVNGGLLLYKINVQAKYEGTIRFSQPYLALYDVAIYRKTPKREGTQIVGTTSSYKTSPVVYWNYPSGGRAIGTVTKDLDDPVSLAISLGSP
jgi:hypothetical protein